MNTTASANSDEIGLNTDFDCDLAIVGGGMVGASLALAIGSDPLFGTCKVALIEAGPVPQSHDGTDFDPRVVALTRRSERFLDRLGVWLRIKQRACPYSHMVVWDGEGTAEIEFNSHEFHQDNLGHIAENSNVVLALLAQLEACTNVQVLRGERVEVIEPVASPAGGPSPGGCHGPEKAPTSLILSSGQRLNAQLVVAADGAHSKIRKLLSMPTREWDYGHTAIVTTVRAKKPHAFTAWQRFMPSGPLAFLPLPVIDGMEGYCSIVWSVDSERAPELMALDDAAFAKALEAAFESRLGPIESVAQRHAFPLRQRHARQYVRPGVALIGDAAHTIHPLAGQGVNLGLLDVQSLVAELRRARERTLPIGDYSILQRYQRERMGHNLAVMGAMEGFKRLFASQQPLLQVARNWGMGQLQQLKPLKAAIAKRAMGL